MATYLTTYSAGLAKYTMAGNHDPADANSGPWDPAVDPDTGHPTSADKPIDERVPWDVPVPSEDPAAETPAGQVAPPELPAPEGQRIAPDPPVGQVASNLATTALEGAPG